MSILLGPKEVGKKEKEKERGHSRKMSEEVHVLAMQQQIGVGCQPLGCIGDQNVLPCHNHHEDGFKKMKKKEEEDDEEEDEEEEEEEDDDDGGELGEKSSSRSGKESKDLALGPLLPLKDQLDMDKDDESLRRWKEQLLGSIPLDHIEGVEPEVEVMSLKIISANRPDMVIKFPLENGVQKSRPLFTLKEGSSYHLQFTFLVKRNIVSGLTYVHTVWKNGIRVDKTNVMFGTFAPQLEPYVHTMEEETTPSGLLARGTYSTRTKIVDDDGRCYFKIDHTFDIRKEWR